MMTPWSTSIRDELQSTTALTASITAGELSVWNSPIIAVSIAAPTVVCDEASEPAEQGARANQ